jgi:hypothetical protein
MSGSYKKYTYYFTTEPLWSSKDTLDLIKFSKIDKGFSFFI